MEPSKKVEKWTVDMIKLTHDNASLEFPKTCGLVEELKHQGSKQGLRKLFFQELHCVP